jgi:excinuclease UvrABC nuclease subunit
MISISVDAKSLKELRNALKGVEKKIPRELATAINATAKKVRLETARELRKVLTVKTTVLKKAIKIKKKASAKSTKATVFFADGHPIPLKYFRARQLKRGGVTYKIDPKFNRKSIIRDAFIVEQYNANVYRRTGKERGPLEKLYGPAPSEAFEKAGIAKVARTVAATELPKQVQRRIRLLALRQQGIVKQRGK